MTQILYQCLHSRQCSPGSVARWGSPWSPSEWPTAPPGPPLQRRPSRSRSRPAKKEKECGLRKYVQNRLGYMYNTREDVVRIWGIGKKEKDRSHPKYLSSTFFRWEQQIGSRPEDNYRSQSTYTRYVQQRSPGPWPRWRPPCPSSQRGLGRRRPGIGGDWN